MRLGIIAEDDSDVEVLQILARRLLPAGTLKVKRFAASGCGQLRRKCRAWGEVLRQRGCSHLVVAHDLDYGDVAEIRVALEASVEGLYFKAKLILIPVREIEAWLLCDADALRSVFGLSFAPKVPKSPQSLDRPKEALRDLIWKSGKSRYLNTIHNAKIAEVLRLEKLAGCASFAPYPLFLKGRKG